MIMTQVTIPKNEYERLKREAAAYRGVAQRFYESILSDPIEEVVEDFRKTNLYTGEFLEDLKDGLRKSSYAKSY